MKLFLILFLISFNTIAGLPPTTSAGQEQSNVTTFNFKVPNAQSTLISGGSLLETGNYNLLINPSFEHSAFSTAWTLNNGSSSVSTSPFHGKQAYQISATAQTPDISQSSTINAAQLSGRTGIARARVKTSQSTIQVCGLANGVEQNCTSVTGDNTWQLIAVSFRLGDTSSGVKIKSTGSITGTILIDDTFVGPDPIAYAIDNVSNASGWQDAGTITITGSTSNPTKGATSLDKVRWRRVGDSMEIRYEYVQTGAGSSGSGDYLLQIPSGYQIDLSKVTADSAIEGGSSDYTLNNSVGIVEVGNSGANGTGSIFVHDSTKVRAAIVYSTAAGNTNSVGVFGSTFFDLSLTSINMTAVFTVPIVGWTASNPNALTAPDTFSTDTNALSFCSSATCTLSNLGSQPIGTFITGSYAINSNTFSGCTTAPTQTTSSMNTNGIQVFTRAYNAASTCASPAYIAINIGANRKGVSSLIYKSLGKVTPGSLDYWAASTQTSYGPLFNNYNESTGVYIIDAGYNDLSTNTGRYFYFSDLTTPSSGYITINASKNPALTGLNIENNVKTPNTVKAILASASVSSSSIVSNEVGDLFNGNCSGTTPAVCTFTSGLFSGTPNCTASPSINASRLNIVALSSSSITIQAENSAGTAVASAYTVICHGVSP